MSNTQLIDDAFTRYLLSYFKLEALKRIDPITQNVMRDCFVSGMVEGLCVPNKVELLAELGNFKDEVGKYETTKARHCFQEAVMIKQSEN